MHRVSSGFQDVHHLLIYLATSGDFQLFCPPLRCLLALETHVGGYLLQPAEATCSTNGDQEDRKDLC